MNLAGLQDVTASMFPAIKGLTPSAEDLSRGDDKLRCGRVVEITGYRSEVFDTHGKKDREAYTKLMMDLSKRVQTGRVRILRHDRQVLSRKDGSTGWFVYLEWMECEFKDREGGGVK